MLAHDFTLLDQDGKEHTLSKLRGKWVVLYFYPKDDTPGCTKEACNFRDSTEFFKEKNVVILGVSKDSVRSHKKFAEKYHLDFPLLSDPAGDIIKKYNAWGKKKFMGQEFDGILRITYLISPQGEIAKFYEDVDPTVHADELLSDISSFQRATS